MNAADVPVTYCDDHAGDRVKWQRWGKAAFDRALKEEKPIALVVGSFAPHAARIAHAALESSPAIVAALNDRFVPVLVDRAEWPGVASAYARASDREDSTDVVVYALTPDLEWLDDLAPASDLAAALQAIADRWKSDRSPFLEEARLKVRRLRARLTAPVTEFTDPVQATLDIVQRRFADGWLRPDPCGLELIVRVARERESERERALGLLQSIDRSALHDLLGGGFHRAVRDAEHSMPFFDKMLADQAALAAVYLDASRVLGNGRFADVARNALEFSVRDLQMRTGGFDDSQQADSLTPVGRPVIMEGAYYLWDQNEILHTFGPKIGARLCERFGVLPGGNIAGSLDPGQAFAGKNILRPARIDPPDAPLAAAIAKMLEIRLHRPMPRRDEPVLESTALMISALARGATALREERYRKAAVAGTLFVESQLDRQGRLFRRPGIAATADDYAAIEQAYIDLYEATLQGRWLDLAIAVQARQDALFWNAAANRYEGGKEVPETVRDFVLAPPALAALNDRTAVNLARLAAITGRDDFRQRADAIGATFRTLAIPAAALLRLTLAAPVTRVIVFGGLDRPDTTELLRAAQASYDPMRVVVYGGYGKNPVTRNVGIGSLLPPPDGTASAYVCRASGCSGALTTADALAASLE